MNLFATLIVENIHLFISECNLNVDISRFLSLKNSAKQNLHQPRYNTIEILLDFNGMILYIVICFL